MITGNFDPYDEIVCNAAEISETRRMLMEAISAINEQARVIEKMAKNQALMSEYNVKLKQEINWVRSQLGEQ